MRTERNVFFSCPSQERGGGWETEPIETTTTKTKGIGSPLVAYAETGVLQLVASSSYTL